MLPRASRHVRVHEYLESLQRAFFFCVWQKFWRKREPNAAGPIIRFNEVATLVHLIESSKPEVRAKGIRLIVLLEVPWFLEGRPCLASVAIYNLSCDKTVRDKKNRWRFRVNLAYVGESTLSTDQSELSSSFTAFSATSHGLGMKLGMTLGSILLVQPRLITSTDTQSNGFAYV